jgi:hypothetical protein
MSSSINNQMSLYIPHVFSNVTNERIAHVFESLYFGRVSHIDVVKKTNKNGENYNSVYIHFSKWFNNTTTCAFQERVLDPNREARVVYDEPWYWIVLENKGKKHKAEDEEDEEDEEGEIPEDAFHEPSFDVVDSKYAEQLEEEVHRLHRIITEYRRIISELQDEQDIKRTNKNWNRT